MDAITEMTVSCYQAPALWMHFKAWREEKEPGVMHVKGETDLANKMYVLCLRLEHAKLLQYFEGRDSGAMESENDAETKDVAFPDLDDMARQFVRRHIAAMNAAAEDDGEV